MRLTIHLAAAVAAALSATTVAAAQKAMTGNGAPSGSHYNLNIIGVTHDKNPNMNGNGSGNVIFVDLGNRTGDAVTTKILLSQAADGVFEVLDKNGTDGEASFSLPVPGTYTVWARALGTPGGQSKIATCATFVDPITGVSTVPRRGHRVSYALIGLPCRYLSNQFMMCCRRSTRCTGLPERDSSCDSPGNRTCTVVRCRYLSARNRASPP